jgi:hypothetical protein
MSGYCAQNPHFAPDDFSEAVVPAAFVGSAEAVRDILCGPQQHSEHCKGWRWHLYMQDSKQRMRAVDECARKIIADRNAPLFAQAAE